jgi:hypothetical protein
MNIVNKNPNLIPELQENPPFSIVREADGTTPWTYIATNADGNKWVQGQGVADVPIDIKDTSNVLGETKDGVFRQTVAIIGTGTIANPQYPTGSILVKTASGVHAITTSSTTIQDTGDVTSETKDGVYRQTVDIIGTGTALNPQYKANNAYLKTPSGIISFNNSDIDNADKWIGNKNYTDEIFSFSTPNTTAVDIDGNKIEANKTYLAKYKVPKTSNTTLTNAEIALFELVSGSSDSADFIKANITLPNVTTADQTKTYILLNSNDVLLPDGGYVSDGTIWTSEFVFGGGSTDTHFKEVSTYNDIKSGGNGMDYHTLTETCNHNAGAYRKLNDGTIFSFKQLIGKSVKKVNKLFKMSDSQEYYELTQSNGKKPKGIYYVNENFMPILIQSFEKPENLYTKGIAHDFNTLPNGTISGLNGGTWSVVNGKAINTPIENPISVVDSSLEAWDDVNNLTHWSKVTTGGVVEQTNDSNSGAFACKLKVNNVGGRLEIQQNISAPLGFVKTKAYIKTNSVGKYIRIKHDNQYHNTSYIYPNTTYSEYSGVSLRRIGSGSTAIQNYGNPNVEWTIDDISHYSLSTNSLFATTNEIGNNVRVKAFINFKEAALSGVVLNIDDISNPQNYLILAKDKQSNQVFLWHIKNGVPTQILSHLINGNQSNAPSGLIELRQYQNTKYQMYFNGKKEGAEIEINDSTLNNNGYHGLFSTDNGVTIEYFGAKNGYDTVKVPNGADLIQYVRYMSAGDTLSLASNGTYNQAPGTTPFANIPNGEDNNYTVVLGNSSTINGGKVGIQLIGSNYGIKRQYIEFNDLILNEQEQTHIQNNNGVMYCIFNNIKMTTTQSTFVDSVKNRSGITRTDDVMVHSLIFNNCETYLTTDTGILTVDGFEDWGTKDIAYNRCVAHGFRNGASNYNNGHGFESYGGNSATPEPCENITYNQCVAYNNRVGFSTEGGVPNMSNINIRALNCVGYNNEIADAGGVNGSTIHVTCDTLTSRSGNVDENID